MRVRAEINLPHMPAGTEHEVDEVEPVTAARLRGGLLTPLSRPAKHFCLRCDPPTFHDSQAALALHERTEHGVEEGDGSTG